jgi:hypothetical protein
MSEILIIGGHGIGDCLLSLQCATRLQQLAINPTVYISARDEVYYPLAHVFAGYFIMSQVKESYSANNAILNDSKLMYELTGDNFSEVYYAIPDLLFNNSFAFDYKKYLTSPQMLKDIRILGPSSEIKNTIYLGLMTTTEGYMYQDPVGLALSLAYNLPEYKVYFPIVTTWANKNIGPIEFPDNIPDNLEIAVDPSINDSFDILASSSYFIGTDNGPSHLAYHMSIPRLILDPQFGRIPWIARWREDYLESVPINTSIQGITLIAKTNLNIPQTTLIPRLTCLSHGEHADWSNLLLLKTS